MKYYIKRPDCAYPITCSYLESAKKLAFEYCNANGITTIEDEKGRVLYALNVLSDGSIHIEDYVEKEKTEKVNRLNQIVEERFITKQSIMDLLSVLADRWSESNNITQKMMLYGGMTALAKVLNCDVKDSNDILALVGRAEIDNKAVKI